MRFRVPQFIDVEDKLFGPLTFKQFAFLAGGAGMIFLVYKILPLWIGIFIIIPVATVTYLLAFQKVNNLPFIHILQAGLSYFTSSRLYIWKQRTPKQSTGDEKNISFNQRNSFLPKSSGGSIESLSRSLDIGGEEDLRDKI